jgi:hypothetical protein
MCQGVVHKVTAIVQEEQAMKTIFIFIFLFFTSSISHAVEINFSDNTFNDSDWTIADHTVGAGGTSNASQLLSGGNPNAYRRITTVLNSGPSERRIFSFNFNSTAIYDPSVSGAIDSIDYSEDAKIFSGAQTIALALRQGGNIFNYSLVNTFVGTSWTSMNATGLIATNFIQAVPGGFDPTLNPDFSATGSIIEFGFMRGRGTPNGPGPGATAIGGIDNWNVTVNSAQQATVPEPGSLSLLIAGMLSTLCIKYKGNKG